MPDNLQQWKYDHAPREPHPQGSGEESSPHRATTKWASGDQKNEPESSEPARIGAHYGDGNEIKCFPLQSRVAVLNLSTSIQDAVSEKLPIRVRDQFCERLEAHGKVISVSEGTTRCASGRGKEFESSEATTRWASGLGKELESSEATTSWASCFGKELESSEATSRWASGSGEELESSKATRTWLSLNTSIDEVTKVALLPRDPSTASASSGLEGYKLLDPTETQ